MNEQFHTPSNIVTQTLTLLSPRKCLKLKPHLSGDLPAPVAHQPGQVHGGRVVSSPTILLPTDNPPRHIHQGGLVQTLGRRQPELQPPALRVVRALGLVLSGEGVKSRPVVRCGCCCWYKVVVVMLVMLEVVFELGLCGHTRSCKHQTQALGAFLGQAARHNAPLHPDPPRLT